MTITLYTNNSENNKIGKVLTTIKTLTGTLRDGTSITAPVITITALTESEIKSINYMYITEFGRYYFVSDIASLRNDVWILNGKVDVLESFKAEILRQKAVVRRQENQWNLYLDDGIFRTYSNPKIVMKKFPNSFDTQSFVLAVAGN